MRLPALASFLFSGLAAAATLRKCAVAPEAAVRYVGRVDPSTKELSWPGSGVSFAFTGTSATIGIARVTGTNSVDLVVDGRPPIAISSFGSSISTPAGLSQGTHTVVLRKRSDPQYGSIFLGNVTTNGAFAPQAVPTRQIELIGDSITVGYGLDGVNPCSNNAAVENHPKTYGAVAASTLGADYNTVAWSGKGLIRNIALGRPDTSPIIPQLYSRYGANDPDGTYTFPSTWSPQAVVINLGTNDFNYIAWDASGNAYTARETLNIPAFVQGMVNFVHSIQEHYPDAHFFLVGSPMLNDGWPTTADAQKTNHNKALRQAVSQLGAKAHFVDWPAQGSDVGCDYHPNAATHAAGAKLLVQAIKSALNW
ncbi:SGNH hydrolase-type esterase domain containing protein [Naviculisporaceae sp. PSN 640]